MNLSQAYFYRTTRSIEGGTQVIMIEDGENDTSQVTAGEMPLAIDKRNTINLQKAIDLYYDGNLPPE